MRYAFAAILGIGLAACGSVQPVPIHAGDVCAHCKRVVSEPRLGAELIATDGAATVFHSPGCLARYLQTNSIAGKTVFVTDYDAGTLIPVGQAMFVRASTDEASGEHDYYAFKSAPKAAQFAEEKYSAVVDWSAVRSQVAKTRGD